ncbi:MAG TPA: hypothetical protein VNO14_06985 [Blastocatellia bacterium]|nr:hypothetical protein [Blastocatellia bacterium]
MRKRTVLALVLIIAINASAEPPVRAESCRSLAQVFSDIWKEWGRVIVATGCVAGAAVATGGAGVAASSECIRNASKYAQAAEAMIAFFNSAAANRWATIGPRRLEYGNTHQGTLVSTGGRVFITPAPLDKNSLTIKIKKLDGRARASVVICKINESGSQTKLEEFEFADGDANIGQEITKTVSGVQNHLVQVHLDAKSLTRRFQFSLRATK